MNRMLELRTKLLVAEYGRDRVIAALAEIESTEIDSIERELDAHRRKKGTRRGSHRVTLPELLDKSGLEPAKLTLVKRIGYAYQNKRYLPELWRVRRFLDSHGAETGNLRSRAAALPLVVQVLSHLSIDQLTEMAAESSESHKGDLGIIADQILGPAKDKSKPYLLMESGQENG